LVADAQVKLALTALGEGNPPEASKLLHESLAGYRATGSAQGLLWVLEGCAHLAAKSGNPRRAATLVGASETRYRGGAFLLEGRELLEADLRNELGGNDFEAARAKGAAMGPDTAVEFALSQELS
jgi:hypothetical protein